MMQNNGQIEAMAFLEEAGRLLDAREERQTGQGDCFNIFTLLSVETSELMHCRFLYELLRPDGSHGMGDALLREFFRMVLKRPVPERPLVKREYTLAPGSGEYGRIDLLIEGTDACYPVEVKIYAEDQDRQLARYEIYAGRAGNHQVFYLTLDGHAPSMQSTEGKDIAECISFSEDIYPWLCRCMELLEGKVSAAESVRMYIKLIEKLTGKGGRDQYMDRLVERLSASEKNYEAAVMVSEALTFARVEMMQRVFREIEGYIGSRLEKIEGLSRYDLDADAYYRTKRKVWPSLTYRLCTKEDITVAFRIEVDWRLCCGIVFYQGDGAQVPGRATELPELFPDRSWQDMTHGYKGKDWWLSWKYLPSEDEYLDFNSCKGQYSKLYGSDRHVEIMQRIFEELDREIQMWGR